jgi:hypothetical protein
MLIGLPFSEKVKFVTAVVIRSCVPPPSAVTGIGFGSVNENDQLSPGALQLDTGALLPHTPLPEIVAESALATADPKLIANSARAKVADTNAGRAEDSGRQLDSFIEIS